MEQGVTQEQLPVFVYGTLRPGQANHGWVLAQATTHAERATLPGHRLYAVGLPFPYATPDPDGAGQVVGDLLELHPDRYHEVLERLDGLEGYRADHEPHSYYLRRRVTVHLAGGRRADAWVYLAGDRTLARLNPAQLSASGDWLAA